MCTFQPRNFTGWGSEGVNEEQYWQNPKIRGSQQFFKARADRRFLLRHFSLENGAFCKFLFLIFNILYFIIIFTINQILTASYLYITCHVEVFYTGATQQRTEICYQPHRLIIRLNFKPVRCLFVTPPPKKKEGGWRGTLKFARFVLLD